MAGKGIERCDPGPDFMRLAKKIFTGFCRAQNVAGVAEGDRDAVGHGERAVVVDANKQQALGWLWAALLFRKNGSFEPLS
jgi:hypothetical protein